MDDESSSDILEHPQPGLDLRKPLLRPRRLLSEPGITYVRERLEAGGILSHLLLERLDLSSGVAFTYLASDVSQEAALRLWDDAGPEVWSGQIIHARIQNFLAADKDALCLLEDDVSDASDPWPRTEPETAIFYVQGSRLSYDPETDTSTPYGDLYWYLTHGDADPGRIDHLLGMSAAYFMTGMLTIRPDPRPLPSRRFVPQNYLESLVPPARAIIMNAYDAMGNVIWVPTIDELGHWPEAAWITV